MIADFAIHDKGDGNPHAHILLTMRAMDEKGRWLPKAKKVYDLDENGEKIRLPSGSYKNHKEPTTDWDRKENAELWRSEWANVVNRYYEKHDLPIRLDLRSFARQGRDELPTIHIGPAVAHMEEKGIPTQLGDYNRQIKTHNTALQKLKRLISSLSAWLKEKVNQITELTKKEAPQPTILDFLYAYEDLQKAGRLDWSTKGKQTAAVKDLKLTARTFSWMQQTGIRTLEDFQKVISEHNADFTKLSENKKAIRKLDTTLKHIDTIARLKPIYDKSKQGFDFVKKKYGEAHKDELAEYQKAVRYMKANKLSPAERDKFAEQRRTLKCENEVLEKKLRNANLDPELIGQIRYCVNKVLETGQAPQHKPSLTETLNQLKSESMHTTPTQTKQIEHDLE